MYTGEPSIILKRAVIVENDTAVFRCEAQFGGLPKNQLPVDDIPFLRIFYADNPKQDLSGVDKTNPEGNILIKVSCIIDMIFPQMVSVSRC